MSSMWISMKITKMATMPAVASGFTTVPSTRCITCNELGFGVRTSTGMGFSPSGTAGLPSSAARVSSLPVSSIIFEVLSKTPGPLGCRALSFFWIVA